MGFDGFYVLFESVLIPIFFNDRDLGVAGGKGGGGLLFIFFIRLGVSVNVGRDIRNIRVCGNDGLRCIVQHRVGGVVSKGNIYRVFREFRGENTENTVSYMVAAGARGGAGGRVSDIGGDTAEIGGVWVYTVLLAVIAGRGRSIIRRELKYWGYYR